MNPDIQSHPLWGRQAPLSSLAGLGFILIASGRTAFALLGALAAVWTFVATVLTARSAAAVLPRFGRYFILTLLSCFYTAFFHLILSILSPVMAAEAALLLFLLPALFMSSGLWRRVESSPLDVAVRRSLAESLVIGSITVALALVREPFGFGSISVPGPRGITELLGSPFAAESAMRFVASSSGALVILGYLAALFRSLKGLHVRALDRQERS